MPSPKSPVEILKLLAKTNCRECREPTCLAFAAAVVKGKKQLSQCPYIDPEVAAKYDETPKDAGVNPAAELDKTAAELKKIISGLDLEALALKAGGKFEKGKLRISIMGKEFAVAPNGELSSPIHLHSWVSIPLLSYVAKGEGKAVTGQWVQWRDLPGGREFEGLFKQRAETPLNAVAENYSDLFENMLDIFNGREVEQLFDSDLSIVLEPLPKVPVLICYWAPEDGLGSNLTLFF